MKSILDPTFRYRSSVNTDLRETFKRVRREQAKQARKQAAPAGSVSSIYPRVKGELK